MTTITGSGLDHHDLLGTQAAWTVLYPAFLFTPAGATSFTVTNSLYGTLTFTGFAFTYSGASITGGTITGITFTGTALANGDTQTWSNLNVSATAAFNAVVAGNQTTFDNLFFSGDDTVNFWSPAGSTLDVRGFAGNDTFNVGGRWSPSMYIDGGAGFDTLYAAPDQFDYPNGPNFNVHNIEYVVVAGGTSYISAFNDLVAAGSSLTLDATALNYNYGTYIDSLTFVVNGQADGSTFSGNLTLLGGGGNDFFEGGAGTNIFSGGGGTNTVSFDTGNLFAFSNGVTVDLSDPNPQSIGGPRGGVDTFINIQNLIGTSRNDTLTGDANDNVLDGGGNIAVGGDVLHGGGGNDTLIGSGFTYFDGGDGNDTLISRGGGGSFDGGAGYDIAVIPWNSTQVSMVLNQTLDQITSPDLTSYLLHHVEAVQFLDKTVQIWGPVVTASDFRVKTGQTVAMSSLFSVNDLNGNAITEYQIRDITPTAGSGYLTVNGVQQAPGAIIDVMAAQLGQVAIVGGSINDNLLIRAFDGTSWSAPDNGNWATFTVGPTVSDRPPVVTSSSIVSSHGQILSLSSLFTVSDPEGDTITRYQLWDANRNASSGYFTINGVQQAAGAIIDVSAAQLAQTAFVVGMVADSLQIRAFDGIAWSAADNASWAPFTVSPPLNNAPVVTTSNRSIVPGSTVALSTLFSVTDADSDAVTKYQLWDATRDPNGGRFVVNGTVQPAGTIIEITAAQLTQTSFVMGTVATNLQIRAFDGLDWSAGENASWSPFTISPRVNHAPVLLSNSDSATPGQSLTLSSLFSVSDADGDAITKYQLWDASRDPNSGHFAVNGVVQSAGTIIEITVAQLAQTSFVVGQLGDNLQIRASDGAAWSAGDNDPWSPLTISPIVPVLSPNAPTGTIGQSLAVSGFFNAVTPNGAITKYQFKDTTSDPASGYFTINGAQQPAGTVIEITAAQLAQAAFVVGHINDAVQIRAFDGTAWSAPDNGTWTSVTVSPPPNHAPSLTTSNKTAAFGTTLALSSLFSVSDADGDSMTKYELWDANRDPSSGHFIINNVDQPAGTILDVTAAQLAQTSFVVGAGADALQIRAFDGRDWSTGDSAAWAPFTVAPIAPAVIPTSPYPTTARPGKALAMSSLFQVSTPNGPITKYQLWDGTNVPNNSGYFVVDGVVQPAKTVIEITAAQLSRTTFVVGLSSDSLQIRAFDGQMWSAGDNAVWTVFTILPGANSPPQVFTIPRTGRKGDMFQLSTLVAVSDADQDTITKYQLWDATRDPSSGYFTVNGVAQPAGTVIEITAAQVSQTFFVLGSVNDNLQIRAFDGTDWSAADNAAWAPFTMTVRPNVLPVVTTANMNAPTTQTLALSSLFSVSDADGDSIPAYQLWDATRDANSGHFVVNGVDQAAGTIIQITADQLSQTSFVTGTVGDSLQIRAMDSRGEWSAGDAAAWSPFTISVRNNTAPVVTTMDKNTTAGQSLTLSSLFSVSDADGDTMTKYQLWDATRDAASGHFVINGVAQVAGTIIDVTAAQLAQTSFRTGTTGDSLQIRAFDGFAWSAGDSAAWAPFHINVS